MTGVQTCALPICERQAQRAHVHLHRARCRFQRLCHPRLYSRAVAETRSGRNHHHRRFHDCPVHHNRAFPDRHREGGCYWWRFQPVYRLPIVVRRSRECVRDPVRKLPGNSSDRQRHVHLYRQCDRPRRRQGDDQRPERFRPDQPGPHGNEQHLLPFWHRKRQDHTGPGELHVAGWKLHFGRRRRQRRGIVQAR